MIHYPRPPAHIEAIVGAIGPEAAADFLMEFGGSELTLPRTPRAGSRLVRCLGPERAQALCDASFDAPYWPRRVPLAKEWVAQVLHAKGLPVAEIARRLHVADSTVRRNLARLDAGSGQNGDDPRQFRLF